MKLKFSIGFLGALSLLALGTAFLPAVEGNSTQLLLNPSWSHWFGTDSLGRDLFLRIMEGTRVSLLLGILSSFFASLLGVGFAFLSYLSGPKIDRFLMRLIEVLLALPSIILIALTVLFFRNLISFDSVGDQILILTLSIVLTSWMPMARQMRTWLGIESTKSFVDSAKALGASPWRILRYHLFPQTVDLLMVYFGLQIPNYLLFESFLSFVGMGVQPPVASWGVLIQEAWKTLGVYPYLLIGPSLVLFMTVFSINVIFSEIQRRLNPKLNSDLGQTRLNHWL